MAGNTSLGTGNNVLMCSVYVGLQSCACMNVSII